MSIFQNVIWGTTLKKYVYWCEKYINIGDNYTHISLLFDLFLSKFHRILKLITEFIHLELLICSTEQFAERELICWYRYRTHAYILKYEL